MPNNLVRIFLEMIMTNVREEYNIKVGICDRNIKGLQFADDIDALAKREKKLEALVESFDKICTNYKLEISTELVGWLF